MRDRIILPVAAAAVGVSVSVSDTVRRRMVIAVDARALTARRGVARYTRRMLEALAADAASEVRALVPGREPVAPVPGVRTWRTVAPSRAVHGIAALTGGPRVDRLVGGADVTWVPAPAPVAAGVPYVLTVHDLSWEERPEDFTAYERLWHRLARPGALVRGAATVVCDHPAVAAAVTARWGVTPMVVEPGVDAAPDDATPEVGRRDRPYLLYVGAREPRKGLDVLATAWPAAGLDADLVIVGEGRVTVPGATHLGHVGDAALHRLYAAALAVVLPSRLEGYGLPPREAAVHGTPSIVSDLPTLRLPGTLRVPPGDAIALAGALRRLVAERARLVAELPEPRTWAAAAAELQAVLRGAAGR